MTTTNNNVMPIAKCPHCGEEVQLNDWYEFHGGEEATCTECLHTMYVIEAESVMYVTLSTQAASDTGEHGLTPEECFLPELT